MSLPRILFIDDQFGGVRAGGRNRLREDLCLTIGLQDNTGDAIAESVLEPIALAVFHRGQSLENDRVYNDIEGTIKVVRKGWLERPRWALLLLDMQFRTGRSDSSGEVADVDADRQSESYFGLEILERLWQDTELHDIPVVVLSSMSRSQIEARFADQGVFDFVDKNDLTRERLRLLVETYGLVESNSIVGHSVPFLKCLREARQRAAIGNDNILILGETGTGKELLARYIHDASPRRAGPYVTVYTQGVPETLIEDRLFGHEKGGFSGAMSSQPGAAEQAHKGSLFIDEFGDVPALSQSKLLRLLDKNTRESQRLGARPDAVRRLDLQVILATNQVDMLDSEGFRKDLLFRVRTADAIRVPPLRQRREDIPSLAEYFLRKSESAFGASIRVESRIISAGAIHALCEYDWPDNVRGLEQVIESAIYRFPKLRVLSSAHLRLPESLSRPSASSLPSQGLSTNRIGHLSEVLHTLGTLDFTDSEHRREDWVGKLPQLQAAYARAAGALVRAALVATLKPTPGNPAGELRIHPAIKLATGDSSISASRAADVIKRVMSIDSSVQTELLEDPVLAAAYRTAMRLRPNRSAAASRV